MCGRATLTKNTKEVEERYQLNFDLGSLSEQLLPNYNLAPTHSHPVIFQETDKQLGLFKWGLIPSWAKDASIASRLINARIETITSKPAFRAIHKRRCLIPLDGFYEWKRMGKTKQPFRIILKNKNIFSVAGIWEEWRSPRGKVVCTFSLLTQAPNELMGTIHNRMPAILKPQEEAIWLDQALPTKDILSIIQPYPSDLMEAYPVSNRVGKVGNNDASLIEKELPKQGTLF